MGVTIHFEGHLSSDEALANVLAAAQAYADGQRWPHELIACTEARLSRVRNEEDWDYIGPTRGIVLFPHADSEPVRLEFDRDLYIQEFTKTQFAGTTVHINVVGLLRCLAPHFASLIVDDEGEYWDTSDQELLKGHFQAFYRALQAELPNYPGAKVKVRLPSGRIADFVS